MKHQWIQVRIKFITLDSFRLNGGYFFVINFLTKINEFDCTFSVVLVFSFIVKS